MECLERWMVRVEVGGDEGRCRKDVLYACETLPMLDADVRAGDLRALHRMARPSRWRRCQEKWTSMRHAWWMARLCIAGRSHSSPPAETVVRESEVAYT